MGCDTVAGLPIQIFEEDYFWTLIIILKNNFISILYWFTGNWSEEKSDVRCSPKRLERPHIHFAADAESEVTGHLVRAPTPYPKELRAMAKHARSFQQQHTRRASREVCVYHCLWHYRSCKGMSFFTLSHIFCMCTLVFVCYIKTSCAVFNIHQMRVTLTVFTPPIGHCVGLFCTTLLTFSKM